MSDTKKHINNQDPFEQDSKDFFNKAEIPYERTKDDIWQSISNKIEDTPSAKTVRFSTERIVLGMAASLIILLSVGMFLRFYSKTIKVEAGNQLTYILPDQSRVILNAESVLRYNPLWWRVSRQVSFEGEAFFKVTKGSSFTVKSIQGQIEVLGTSFNVYSRPDSYRVTCLTGKVSVTNSAKEQVILTSDYQATILSNGIIVVRKEEKASQTVSWKDGMFNFTATPLMEVIHEIERQYNVQIYFADDQSLTYTGFFSRDYSLEDVLNLVCKPFNLNYTKKREKVYEIKN